MSYLSQFGKVVFGYSGRGYFTTDETNREYDFEAGQLADGTMWLFLTSNNFFYIQDMGDTYISFKGITQDGQTLIIDGPSIVRKHTSNITQDKNKYCIYICLNDYARIMIGELDNRGTEIEFYISNFRFLGTEPVRISETHVKSARLSLSLDSIDVQIDQLPDYDERISQLKASEGYDITCQLSVSLEKCSVEKAIKVASFVCDLLSIARGRRINWICLRVQNVTRELIYSEHQSRLLTPFSGIELIDYMPPEITKDYLEECYAHCSKSDFRFNINHIANISTDIHSRGFIETRCLLIFSLLDHFFHIVSDLPEKKRRSIGIKARIELLINNYNVPTENDEINWYESFRNKLVHELTFLSDDPGAEYMRLLHLFHRILLRILGYSGYYLNVTKMLLWAGSKADKIVPDNG